MPCSGPIGIFDSGVGGLSVLYQIRRLLPAEELLYVADNGHLPYGNKSQDHVKQRSEDITNFLIQQGAKAIVVACNTATAAAISDLRQRFDLPIIGMEPGVKPGIQQSSIGKIAILATEGTLGSDKFHSLMERHGNGAEVLIQPCHGWVELVEQEADGNTIRQKIDEQVTPLLKKGVDTFVLGCTHYPFLSETIKNIAGEEIQIIDTGLAVARQLSRRLAAADLRHDGKRPGSEQFWSSRAEKQIALLISRLWGKPCKISALPV